MQRSPAGQSASRAQLNAGMQRRASRSQASPARQSASRLQPVGTHTARSQRNPAAQSPSRKQSPRNTQRALSQAKPGLQSLALVHCPVNAHCPITHENPVAHWPSLVHSGSATQRPFTQS